MQSSSSLNELVSIESKEVQAPSNGAIPRKKMKEKRNRVQRPKSKPVESYWADLPDLILEQIFSYLSMRHRYAASRVCRRWYEAFYLPSVWSDFVMTDMTLVRRKFNYYMGWQYVLDHMRTQNCLAAVGKNIKSLIFEPMFSFHNLYEFVVMLTYYAERNEQLRSGKVLVDVRGGQKGIASRISRLRFTFPCNMAPTGREEDEYIFGTGGLLLESLKRLMGSLGRTLRHLQLADLLLERFEALKLLDDVCYSGCETLESLTLINVTKVPCQMLHAGVFVKLRVLKLSPQNLGEDLLILLGDCPHLRHLHIIQNRYTTDNLSPLSWKSWRACRWANPRLNVHLQLENVRDGEVLWQPGSPVRSILYKSAHLKATSGSILTAIDQYRGDLQVYGHLGLPRFHRSKSFHDRIDPLILLMCRQCPNLHTIIVRERISTATVLLLAYTGLNLRFLHVRRNAVVLRRDWPRSPEWSDTFYKWLSTACRSYEATEREVSQILGYKWTMLTDRQFKLMSVDLHQTPFFTSATRASFHTYVPPPTVPVAEKANNAVPMQKRREKKKQERTIAKDTMTGTLL
ncbi:uncharacterized protein LOC132203657 [Neocloeon triangulifer]|uniref:uncharacterized protein LOC132203657 n=1 Tax=Neocloeon triangulifer TaxID=2078957 RepID=UPI00286F56AF|nr:uncharacterized protein LOC132203657 [Neocloeon triangulifer]